MSADVIQRLRDAHLLEHAERFAKIHCVSVKRMLSHTHQRDAVLARHALWTMLHERRHSYASIAALFGFEHTTVITGVKRYLALETRHEELGHYEQERLDGIEARLEHLERLSARLEKACETVESLAASGGEIRRAS